MLSISCKSSTICSCSGILIVNNGGNVLLIEFALAEGMPELLVYFVNNVSSQKANLSFLQFEPRFERRYFDMT